MLHVRLERWHMFRYGSQHARPVGVVESITAVNTDREAPPHPLQAAFLARRVQRRWLPQRRIIQPFAAELLSAVDGT